MSSPCAPRTLVCCTLETTGLVGEGLRLQRHEVEAVHGVKHPVGRRSRWKSQAVLGEERCSLDGCSCPQAPGKGSAKHGNPTKHGSWKQMKRISGQERNNSWAKWLPGNSRLSLDARPCPWEIEASGEWSRLSSLCPLETCISTNNGSFKQRC